MHNKVTAFQKAGRILLHALSPTSSHSLIYLGQAKRFELIIFLPPIPRRNWKVAFPVYISYFKGAMSTWADLRFNIFIQCDSGFWCEVITHWRSQPSISHSMPLLFMDYLEITFFFFFFPLAKDQDNTWMASRKMPTSAVAHSSPSYTRREAPLSKPELYTQNPAPGMEESTWSFCLLYAKVVKVLTMHV